MAKNRYSQTSPRDALESWGRALDIIGQQMQGIAAQKTTQAKQAAIGSALAQLGATETPGDYKNLSRDIFSPQGLGSQMTPDLFNMINDGYMSRLDAEKTKVDTKAVGTNAATRAKNAETSSFTAATSRLTETRLTGQDANKSLVKHWERVISNPSDFSEATITEANTGLGLSENNLTDLITQRSKGLTEEERVKQAQLTPEQEAMFGILKHPEDWDPALVQQAMDGLAEDGKLDKGLDFNKVSETLKGKKEKRTPTEDFYFSIIEKQDENSKANVEFAWKFLQDSGKIDKDATLLEIRDEERKKSVKIKDDDLVDSPVQEGEKITFFMAKVFLGTMMRQYVEHVTFGEDDEAALLGGKITKAINQIYNIDVAKVKPDSAGADSTGLGIASPGDMINDLNAKVAG